MSIQAFLNGRPAGETERFRSVLEDLGDVPQESDRRVFLWAQQPEGPPANSVWINPGEHGRHQWLASGGAILEHQPSAHGSTLHRLVLRDTTITVRAARPGSPDPAVLAAFLTHDFPLVDALMLERAYRDAGWPYDLADYPVPLDAPSSTHAFPSFPRHAGLYAVVPTSEWVRRLAAVSLPVVQLRDKRQDAATLSECIAEAVQAVTGTETLLFINDHWQLAARHGAYGVHLGQEDIAAADLAAIRNAGLRLGISTHGIYEMLRAHCCKPSYMALGAVYATATKSMPTSPQGLRRLAHYVRLMSPHYPLVAIGGIDLSRIAGIWATGVDCAAVLRAIVDASDYRAATAALLAATPQLACEAGRP